MSNWFRKTTYEETYNSIIYPINGQQAWERTPYPNVFPQKKRVMPGRPKKKRRLETWEIKKDDTQLRKGGYKKRCIVCRGVGHNRTFCPHNTQSKEPQSTQFAAGPSKQTGQPTQLGPPTQTGSINCAATISGPQRTASTPSTHPRPSPHPAPSRQPTPTPQMREKLKPRRGPIWFTPNAVVYWKWLFFWMGLFRPLFCGHFFCLDAFIFYICYDISFMGFD